MRRLLAVFLCLAITLCCLPFPALAAEDTGFSDVTTDDWFAPYVAVCVEEGLMQGAGDGRFDPQRELTLAELIVLTARLYSQTMEEDIPAAPLGEGVDVDEALIQLWPFFVDQDMSPPEESDSAAILLAMDNNEQLAKSKFWNQLTADPTPYSWYLNEVCYLSDQRFPHLDELQQTLRYQEGTAANTLATRGDFGELMGDLLPSPIVLHAPEDLPDIDSSGVLTLIGAGVMEGTGEGYALDKSLTRAECAAMLARMMRPELRKAATVDARHPEELIGLEIRHSSFGQTECKYTLDFEEKTFTAWYSGYFQEAEDREETTSLTDEALAGFWQSQAPEALLRWGEVYYNINIMDGHQWGVTLTFSDGETREINGSNAYPQGWDLVYDALLELTGQNIMALRSNWLDH